MFYPGMNELLPPPLNGLRQLPRQRTGRVGRPRTIVDMREYKAFKAREYRRRAKLKAQKEAEE